MKRLIILAAITFSTPNFAAEQGWTSESKYRSDAGAIVNASKVYVENPSLGVSKLRDLSLTIVHACGKFKQRYENTSNSNKTDLMNRTYPKVISVCNKY
ncbi:hypothetical protein H4J50_18725 [Colwellia sp. 6M3]|uniref:hypothetical protein n=1 Tax=Colwellia sp. 6M3 TaxID=2759849 RepID=UPI0015F74512|nr:hypothetical protein [Colwellia sp. 6M3]MBA6418025.1 hypothetical protein [Colwellia sp. 6M3]